MSICKAFLLGREHKTSMPWLHCPVREGALLQLHMGKVNSLASTRPGGLGNSSIRSSSWRSEGNTQELFPDLASGLQGLWKRPRAHVTSQLICKKDDYSDWRNTLEVMCQPTGPTASEGRVLLLSPWKRFLPSTYFAPYSLPCGMSFVISSEKLHFSRTEVMSFSETPSRANRELFLNDNEIIKSTLFLGQIINMNSPKSVTWGQ